MQIQHSDETLRELTALKKLNQDLVHNSPLAMFTIGRNGYITYANPAFLSLHDMDNPLAARRIKVYSHPSFIKSGISRDVKKVFRGYNVEEDYIPYELPSGRKLFLKVHLVPVRNKANKIKECLAMAEDITDTVKLTKFMENQAKELEEEVQKRTRQLQSAYDKLNEEYKLKNDLFNITSHELKTPLISMMGYLELLNAEQLGKINKQQRDAVTRVYKNTKRLHKLICEILDLSKLQAKQMLFSKKTISPMLMLKDITAQFKADAQKKGIKILLDAPKSLPQVKLDPRRTGQAISQVVENALAFTPKGHVMIKAKAQKGELLIDVIDTGIGIPKKYKQKIFQKFFQVDTRLNRDYDGVGLGLSISKILLQNQGCNLELLHSVSGKGSTFRVSIPLKKA